MFDKAIRKVSKLLSIIYYLPWLRSLLQFGVAAGVEHACVLKNLSRLSAIVDIGAHRGQFSLAARRYSRSARIVAFEPQYSCFLKYRSIFECDPRVRVVNCAVGSLPGKAQFHFSQASDSSSLLPITETQSGIFRGTAEVGTAIVDVVSLGTELHTSELGDRALLKIDVQGYEYEAIIGCKPILDRFAFVYCECSFLELYKGQRLASEVLDLLSKNGFVLIGVYNLTYDKRGLAVQGDFLLRNAKL